MTTLVCDSKCLAIDSLVTAQGAVYGEMKKLYHKPGVGAVGFSGEAASYELAASWIFNGANENKRPEILSKMEWFATYLTKEGVIYRVAFDEPLHKVDGVSYLGSGFLIAMGAYFTTSDPVKSVEAAIALDCYTGGKVSLYVANADRAARAFVMNEEGKFEDDGSI